MPHFGLHVYSVMAVFSEVRPSNGMGLALLFVLCLPLLQVGCVEGGSAPTRGTGLSTTKPLKEDLRGTKVRSIRVGTKTLRFGDKSDDVLPAVRRYVVGSPIVRDDPTKPGRIEVTHFVRVDGKAYTLEFRAFTDEGPYKLFAIHDVTTVDRRW